MSDTTLEAVYAECCEHAGIPCHTKRGEIVHEMHRDHHPWVPHPWDGLDLKPQEVSDDADCDGNGIPHVYVRHPVTAKEAKAVVARFKKNLKASMKLREAYEAGVTDAQLAAELGYGPDIGTQLACVHEEDGPVARAMRKLDIEWQHTPQGQAFVSRAEADRLVKAIG